MKSHLDKCCLHVLSELWEIRVANISVPRLVILIPVVGMTTTFQHCVQRIVSVVDGM